jgi:hypothetical protein
MHLHKMVVLKRVKAVILAILFCTVGVVAPVIAQTKIWKLEDTSQVGNLKPLVLGNPRILREGREVALAFDGVDDGLVVPAIPIEGWRQFTIEVLFKPDLDGPREPRFIHFEDGELNRGTFEVRVTKKGEFYMDTFLKNGKSGKGLTLIDSNKLHPAGKWYWASMVYDGKKMTSFLNGEKELEGEIDFPAMTSGNISFGVRLNKVGWFKGAIKAIRFHPAVLDPKKMQRTR